MAKTIHTDKAPKQSTICSRENRWQSLFAMVKFPSPETGEIVGKQPRTDRTSS